MKNERGIDIKIYSDEKYRESWCKYGAMVFQQTNLDFLNLKPSAPQEESALKF